MFMFQWWPKTHLQVMQCFRRTVGTPKEQVIHWNELFLLNKAIVPVKRPDELCGLFRQGFHGSFSEEVRLLDGPRVGTAEGPERVTWMEQLRNQGLTTILQGQIRPTKFVHTDPFPCVFDKVTLPKQKKTILKDSSSFDCVILGNHPLPQGYECQLRSRLWLQRKSRWRNN